MVLEAAGRRRRGPGRSRGRWPDRARIRPRVRPGRRPAGPGARRSAPGRPAGRPDPCRHLDARPAVGPVRPSTWTSPPAPPAAAGVVDQVARGCRLIWSGSPGRRIQVRSAQLDRTGVTSRTRSTSWSPRASPCRSAPGELEAGVDPGQAEQVGDQRAGPARLPDQQHLELLAPLGRAVAPACSSVSAAAWTPATGVRSSWAASARNCRLRSSAPRARASAPSSRRASRPGPRGLADLGVGPARAAAGRPADRRRSFGPARPPRPAGAARAGRSARRARR